MTSTLPLIIAECRTNGKLLIYKENQFGLDTLIEISKLQREAVDKLRRQMAAEQTGGPA